MKRRFISFCLILCLLFTQTTGIVAFALDLEGGVPPYHETSDVVTSESPVEALSMSDSTSDTSSSSVSVSEEDPSKTSIPEEPPVTTDEREGGTSSLSTPEAPSAPETPESSTPDTGTPEASSAPTDAPESSAPDTGTPEASSAPETPESSTPDTSTPEASSAPDASEGTTSDVASPVQSKPVEDSLGASQPDQPIPESFVTRSSLSPRLLLGDRPRALVGGQSPDLATILTQTESTIEICAFAGSSTYFAFTAERDGIGAISIPTQTRGFDIWLFDFKTEQEVDIFETCVNNINKEFTIRSGEKYVLWIAGSTNEPLHVNLTLEGVFKESTLEFQETTVNHSETISNYVLTVNRLEDLHYPVTVDFEITGTATYGDDYTCTQGQKGAISFAANETSKSFTINITDDEIKDDAETIVVTLSNPSDPSVTLGSNDTATITIKDYVASITVNSADNSADLSVGETLQMSAQVLPTDAVDSSVTWSVSDDSKATIDTATGLLTAKAPGAVTVTATSTDGSNITGSKEINIVKYVAQVGTQKYTTWAEAVAAVTENQTITLLSDISLTSADKMPSVPCIIDGGKRTLTLNIFNTLKANTTLKDINLVGGYLIFEEYSLTIEGNVNMQTTFLQGTKLNEASNLYINGTLNCTTTNAYLIDVKKGAVLTTNDAITCRTARVDGIVDSDKFTVSGKSETQSSLSGSGTIVFNRNVVESENIASLNITDASISDDCAIKLQINYGTFKGDKFIYTNMYDLPNLDKLSLTGYGSGYIFKRVEDGTYIYHVLAIPVAQVGTVKYASFADAVKAINTDPSLSSTGSPTQATLNLLADITLTADDAMPDKPCTIDGGNRTLTLVSTTHLRADTILKDITFGGDQTLNTNSDYLFGSPQRLTIEGRVSIHDIVGANYSEQAILTVNGNLNANMISNMYFLNVAKDATINALTSIANITNANISGVVNISCGSFSMFASPSSSHGQLSGDGTICFKSKPTNINLSFIKASIADDCTINLQVDHALMAGDVVISNSGSVDPIANIDKIILAGNASNYLLLKNSDSGHYKLAEKVSSIDVATTPSSLYYNGHSTVKATLKGSSTVLNYDGTMKFYYEGETQPFAEITAHDSSGFITAISRPIGNHKIRAVYSYANSFVNAPMDVEAEFSFEVTKSPNLTGTPISNPIAVATNQTDDKREFKLYLPDTIDLNFDDTGDITYAANISENKDGLLDSISVQGNILVLMVNGGKVDKLATIGVTIASENYTNLSVPLTIKGDNSHQLLNLVAKNVSVSGSLVYGEPLSNVAVSGAVYNYGVEGEQYLAGNFRWNKPNETPVAGSYLAEYTWYSNDLKATQYSGKVQVTVKPRPITVTLTSSGYGQTYGGPAPLFWYTITGGSLYQDDKLTQPTLISDDLGVGRRNVIADPEINTNYAITVSNGANALMIFRKIITLEKIDLEDKIYDGARDSGRAVATFAGAIPGDTIDYQAVATPYASADVGTHDATVTVTLTGTSDKNYVMAETNQKTVAGKITKATTSAVAPDKIDVIEEYAQSYSFDLDSIALNGVLGAKTAGKRTYTINSGTIDFIDKVTLDGSVLTFMGVSTKATMKTATIHVTIHSTNYEDVISPLQLSLIPKTRLVVSDASIPDKVYDGESNPPIDKPIFRNGDAAVEIANPVYQYSGRDGTTYSSTVAPTNAGNYTLVISVPKDSPYTGSKSFDYTIKKATLKVKPSDLFCYVGSTLPTAEIVYDGFVNGDTKETALVGSYTAAHSVADTAKSGKFEIDLVGNATAPNYVIETSKGMLIVRAMSSNAIYTDPNSVPTVNKPHVTIPNGSLSGNVKLSDIRLVVDTLTQTEVADHSSVVSQEMPSIPQSQTYHYDISLIDTANNNAIVEPTGMITVTLPYPQGTDSRYTFTVLHLVGGVNPVVVPCTNTPNGIEFRVSSFSPFIIGYTKNFTESHEESSSYSTLTEEFWHEVKDNINQADAGDVIEAKVSSSIKSVPISVLDALYGKDITLLMSWEGNQIAIYGKTMYTIEPNRIYYNLVALATMYNEEVLTADPPINPITGGAVDLNEPSVVIDSTNVVADVGDKAKDPSATDFKQLDTAEPIQETSEGSVAAEGNNYVVIAIIGVLLVMLVGATISWKSQNTKDQ